MQPEIPVPVVVAAREHSALQASSRGLAWRCEPEDAMEGHCVLEGRLVLEGHCGQGLRRGRAWRIPMFGIERTIGSPSLRELGAMYAPATE
jgi:hypothetical protein